MKLFRHQEATSREALAETQIICMMIAALLSLTSCIYDAPNDKFYRTLWVSDQTPFSNYTGMDGEPDPALVSFTDPSEESDLFSCTKSTFRGLTIEFLCGNNIRIHATGAVGSYGKYTSNDMTAYFIDLNLTYYHNGYPVIIVIEEAHRTDNMLLISWHYSGSTTTYSSHLVRKNSYL